MKTTVIRILEFFLLGFLCVCCTRGNHTSILSEPTQKFKILGVFGFPGKSHFDVFRPLLEELALRGHELTVVSYFPRKNVSSLPNYRDISLTKGDDIFLNIIDITEEEWHPFASPIVGLIQFRSWALEYCQEHVNMPAVKELIKSDAKFDLIITESFNSDCFLGFVHRFKAPFIALSSHVLMPWTNPRVANPDNPSYIPNLFYGHTTTMDFFQRIVNILTLPIMKLYFDIGTNWPMQKIVEEAFGPGVPPLSDIIRNTSLILVNTHYSLHGAKPNQPAVIEVGGLHVKNSSSNLSSDLKQFLDNASEGVLYFSLGSMIKASSMSEGRLNMILETIGKIPRKVIWKWEDPELPNKPANVFIDQWLPQATILRHPNVKCYLAHGGLLGMSEGVSAGVPMVVVPMYGDQFNNAAAAQARGVAIVLEWDNLNAENLRSAIDRVFNDSSYQMRAKMLQKAWNDRPASPLETAVWWTEYIARGNGNQFLRSSAADLSWYQIALLDVIAVCAAVMCLFMFITYRIIKFFVNCLSKKKLDDKKSNLEKKRK